MAEKMTAEEWLREMVRLADGDSCQGCPLYMDAACDRLVSRANTFLCNSIAEAARACGVEVE